MEPLAVMFMVLVFIVVGIIALLGSIALDRTKEDKIDETNELLERLLSSIQKHKS